MPLEVARRLAHMDADGTTVAKTPFARAVRVLLTYRCVHTPGKYSPHTLEVPAERALLSSFSAERGTGQ